LSAANIRESNEGANPFEAAHAWRTTVVASDYEVVPKVQDASMRANTQCLACRFSLWPGSEIASM